MRKKLVISIILLFLAAVCMEIAIIQISGWWLLVGAVLGSIGLVFFSYWVDHKYGIRK